MGLEGYLYHQASGTGGVFISTGQVGLEEYLYRQGKWDFRSIYLNRASGPGGVFILSGQVAQ